MKLMEILFFLFIISVSIFIVSLIMVIKSKNYKGKVEGIIINVREDFYYYKLNRVYTYYPSFRYTVDGITYEREYPYGEASAEEIPVGNKVLLIYDEAHPENFITDKNVWHNRVVLGFVLSSIILAVIIGKYLGL